MVFRKRRKVIFVHGCFWHRHRCASGRSTPSTRKSFWEHKLEGNRKRDKEQTAALRYSGWKVFVVWECQLTRRKLDLTITKILRFLDS